MLFSYEELWYRYIFLTLAFSRYEHSARVLNSSWSNSKVSKSYKNGFDINDHWSEICHTLRLKLQSQIIPTDRHKDKSALVRTQCFGIPVITIKFLFCLNDLSTMITECSWFRKSIHLFQITFWKTWEMKWLVKIEQWRNNC